MSMFDDVLGFGRTSVMESMSDDALEPEIAGMTLEEAADIDEDPMDFMLRVAYENEMNMMNLDAAIVAEEYMYLRENGQEMVTEAGKLEGVISKFKSMVQKLWNKIQSFFKTVINKIESALKLDQRFLDKYADKAKGRYGKARGTSGYLAIDYTTAEAIALMEAIASVSTQVFDRLRSSKANADAQAVDRLVDAKLGKIVGPIDGEKQETTKDLMKALIKSYKPEDASKVEAISADKAIETFKKTKSAKVDIKKAYDTNKKIINNQLKTAKKMESVCKKAKIIPTEESKAIHGTVKILNKLGSTLTLIDRTYIKIINDCRNFCKAVIISAASTYNADDKKRQTAQGESSSLIESFDLL